MPVNYSNSGGTGLILIPQRSSDPVSPVSEDTWVLHTTIPAVTGTPIGLLLALTHSTSTIEMYQLSYFTLENTIVRAVLS